MHLTDNPHPQVTHVPSSQSGCSIASDSGSSSLSDIYQVRVLWFHFSFLDVKTILQTGRVALYLGLWVKPSWCFHLSLCCPWDSPFPQTQKCNKLLVKLFLLPFTYFCTTKYAVAFKSNICWFMGSSSFLKWNKSLEIILVFPIPSLIICLYC